MQSRKPSGFCSFRRLTISRYWPSSRLSFASRRNNADMLDIAVSTAFWSAAILSLAWLAAARRSNLARWGIVLAFLVHETAALIVSVAYGQFHSYVAKLGQENWTNPLLYIIPVLEVVAAACLFSPSARKWFKKAEL
jgi:hypothetical protein